MWWLFKVLLGDVRHKHDWEVIEQLSVDAVERSVVMEDSVYPQYVPRAPEFRDRNYLNRKICLTCGERVDEIAEYKKTFREKERIAKERKEIAEKMW